ncbi:MAG: glycosyltransferase family 4 protein [Bacteroidetes bacterium]|nr:glycosyltransferase family 4 protein [Bacteroidota bacterium]
MKQKSTTQLKIFLTAYAVNPFKGSEDGMGWNYILQIARNQKVIAVTRKNNGPAIEKYMQENPELNDLYSNIEFKYFDWPLWLIFCKKGPVLSLIYYYFWQFTLAIHFRKLRHKIDVVHNLNFHNDWTPTFLWMWRKPLVWGPVGHHPLIPFKFLRPFYGYRVVIMDRFLWMLKNLFWHFDPFLKLSVAKSTHVFCMHKEAAQKLGLKNKFSILPSVASEEVEPSHTAKEFNVLSVGRFVALKGFDITIKSFFTFYSALQADEKRNVKLILVGSGPEKSRLIQLINSLGLEAAVQIIEWIPRNELKELYKTASVFLFPSHEGAGMVVSEAMSYGVPVLCWDNCGPGRFIHPSSKLRVKYVPSHNSINTFADHLMQLKTDPEFISREKSLARERFLEAFNWDLRADELSRVYTLAARSSCSTFAEQHYFIPKSLQNEQIG